MKYTLKKVTSSIRLQNVFRRVSHGGSNNKQTEAEQVHKLVFEMKKNIFFCLFQRTRPIYKDFLKKFTKTITRKKYKMLSLLLKSLEPGLVDESTFVPYDPSQEPLFPPELTLSPHLDQQELVFRYYLYTLYTTVL